MTDSVLRTTSLAQKPRARTTPALISELSQQHGVREAIVDGRLRLTFSGLWDQCRTMARGLVAHGVKPGDHVAILMGNRAEWLIADLALSCIGATMVSVSTYVTAKELQYILDHSDSSALIYESSFLKYDYTDLLGQLEPLSRSLPKLRSIFCLGESAAPGSIAWQDVLNAAPQVPDAQLDGLIAAVRPEDIAALLYTSGSTSTPKGVQIAHGDAIENMWHIGERMHVGPDDRYWCAISLFWGLGCMNILYSAFTHAACLVIQRSFEAGEALRLIEEERCSVLYAFPNIIAALQDHPDRPGRDLSSLRTGGTAGTPEQIRKVIELGATEICQIYGLTETYGNCNVMDGRLDPLEKRLSTCGRPLPGVRQRIVNPETMEPCRPNEVGEIQILTRVTPGYYKDEDKNLEAYLPDGYFRSGDLGMLDEDGYLQFKGRLKDMIKAGGINVSPSEVEKEILGYDGIAAVYVVAVPDPVKDEVVGAVVVIDEDLDHAGLEMQLREGLTDTLSTYKRPAVYRFVREADLPLTTTGKVKRNELSALFGRDVTA